MFEVFVSLSSLIYLISIDHLFQETFPPPGTSCCSQDWQKGGKGSCVLRKIRTPLLRMAKPIRSKMQQEVASESTVSQVKCTLSHINSALSLLTCIAPQFLTEDL
jgi:hypothetical protein